MVDGVNNGGPTGHQTLKLKGKDSQTINLNQLKGLQKTEKNKALFEKYDLNNDGVIDEKEAVSMRNNLQSLAGNGTISKREINKFFGKDSNALDALSNLAQQQESIEKNGAYKETNGNTTTHIYKGSTEDSSYRYDETRFPKGTVKYTLDDGSEEVRYADGKRLVTDKDGKKTFYDAQGNVSLIKNTDGSTLTHLKDLNTTVLANKDGKMIQSLTSEKGEEIRSDYSYTDDGKTITREYDVTNAPTGEIYSDTKNLKQISVRSKNQGHAENFVYNSEDDMKNNRPSELITDENNPVLKKTTKFSYDEKGNVKAETTDSAGNTTVKYTNAKGEEIDSKQYDGVQTYTVQHGDSITKIISESLKEQGLETKDLTPEQMKQVREQLLEANKDNVHVYNGSKPEWKGNKFFYPNTELNIPQYTFDPVELEEVVATTPKSDKKDTALAAAMDKEFGKDFKLPEGYTAEVINNTLTVKDDKGNKLGPTEINLLKSQNNPEIIDKAKGETSDDEDINEMISRGDKDNSQTLNKDEYKSYMYNLIKAAGLEVTEANKEKIDSLIDGSFSSIDKIKQDEQLSKDELTKNAKAVIEKLTDDLIDV